MYSRDIELGFIGVSMGYLEDRLGVGVFGRGGYISEWRVVIIMESLGGEEF